MSKGIFITATGTDVGKTYITALLVKKMRQYGYAAGYYKAALSGAEVTDTGLIPGDAAYVAATAGLEDSPASLVSYIYKEAVSPHLAAQHEGNPVDMKKIVADYATSLQKFSHVFVEGSGGIICPIRWDSEKILLENIILKLQLETLVVSNAALGSINACALTVNYLQQKNISVRGIILNNYDDADTMQRNNKEMMEQLCRVPVIACVASGADDIELTAEALTKLFD